MSKPIRYRVVKACFVNGSLVEPEPGREVFVVAAPGLQGSALVPAPEPAAKLEPAPRKSSPREE